MKIAQSCRFCLSLNGEAYRRAGVSDFEKRVHGLIAGYVWGDICGWTTHGWSLKDIDGFFGNFDGPPSVWPEKVRGLPSRLRRRILPPGIHSASAQQGLSVTNVFMDSDGWRLRLWIEWMVGSLDKDALRGYDRVLLAAMHRLRSGMEIGETPSGLGIDAVARCAPMAILYAKGHPKVALAAAEASLATHGELSTAVMSISLIDALAHLLENQGSSYDLPTFIGRVQRIEKEWLTSDLPWTVQRGAAEDVSLTLEAFEAQTSRKGGTAEALFAWANIDVTGESYVGLNRIDAMTTYMHSVLSALYDEGEPQEILNSIVAHGGDAGPAGAIAGAVLGARFGTSWIPQDRFVDRGRFESYSASLIAGQRPEDFPIFAEHERALSRTTAAFRQELLAERRTGMREPTPTG